MPVRTPPKGKRRLSFRVNEEHKRLIVQAARDSGLTITDFAISILVGRSKEIIHENTIRELSSRDTEIFMRMLDRSARPNAALKKAVRRYQRRG